MCIRDRVRIHERKYHEEGGKAHALCCGFYLGQFFFHYEKCSGRHSGTILAGYPLYDGCHTAGTDLLEAVEKYESRLSCLLYTSKHLGILPGQHIFKHIVEPVGDSRQVPGSKGGEHTGGVRMAAEPAKVDLSKQLRRRNRKSGFANRCV